MQAGTGANAGNDTGASPAERYAASRERDREAKSELGRFRSMLGFELDDFQVRGCQALEEGRGVLVAAPTGAGKTVVGEFAVHLAITAGRKAFYTTPIKALSNQKYADLVRRYGADSVGLLTGDTTVNGDAPVVVMTTEVLRNMLYAGSPTLDGLAFVVMDEVHYLADRFRGPVWEEVIIHLSDDVQLVSLSATVSNAEEFGDWLEMVRGDTAVVVSERRPVPLWQHVVLGRTQALSQFRDDRDRPAGPRLVDLYAGSVDPTDPGPNPPISPELLEVARAAARASSSGGGRGGRRGGHGGGRQGGRGGRDAHRGGPPQGARRGAPRWAVVETLQADELLPAIYFIFSRAGCQGAVEQCLSAGLRLTSAAEESQIRAVVEQRCATIPSEDLDVLGYWTWVESLARGVAAHHAGMLPLFKETVEELFSRGLVKVVFATETLALGINMPARSVVLEKLVKWNGTTHVDVTPGEYTQLTGRAGRRGIDVEGHATVVDHPDLDPIALAGLASKRLYPLRSSFRPTYNMSVNLVAQVGRDRAREVLETSFAQFQADRGVVGLAKQAQAHAEGLEGYEKAMTCDRGDFREYLALRAALSARENELARSASQQRRAEVSAQLDRLKPGDLVEVPSGRRSGHVVVVDRGQAAAGFEGPSPTVLTSEGRVKRLTVADASAGVRVVGSVRVPKGFNARNAKQRHDLQSALRAALNDRRSSAKGSARERRSTAADDAELARLRSALRAHPCHGCADREEHARWGVRYEKLAGEHQALVRRIENRTGSIAKVFDRTCDVLTTLHYLAPTDDGGLRVTRDGQWLRRLYAENDLLLAECLRRHAWDDLDAPGLAAVVSAVVYQGRRDDGAEPYVPGGPQGRLAGALEATVKVWSALDDLERARRVETSGELDLGLVAPIHRWANGRHLEAALRGTDLAAGDFVRWCKQVIDVLDQVSQAAPTNALRATARTAVEGLRRGVVAYSSV